MALQIPILNPTQTELSADGKETLKKALRDRVFLGGKSLKFFSVDTLHLQWASHHEDWRIIARSEKKALIECARGHGKSVFWCFTYPIWRVRYAEKPISICIVSYSQDQVVLLSGKIKAEIETNPLLYSLLPSDYKDTWTKTEMQFPNGCSISARSFGSAVRGGHYDLIIVDDPIKDRSDMSEEDALNFFYAVLYPTLNPGGQIIVDGTPVKFDDLLENIEQNKEFHVHKFPAIKKGKALWEERYPLQELEDIKRTVGSWRFSREYLLERISPDTAPLKRDWLKYWEGELPKTDNRGLPIDYITFMAVDPGISKEETADHSGIVVVKVDNNNNLYVIDLVKKRYNPLELINEIFVLYDRWRPICIGLEIVAFQKVLSYWIGEEGRKRQVILPIKEIRSNKSKNERIMGLQPRMEVGKLIIHPTMIPLITEIEKFRLEVDGSDDLLDALAMTNELVYLPKEREEDKLAKLPLLEQKVWQELEKFRNKTAENNDLLY